MFFLRLFVSGDSKRSRHAIAQAESLCGRLPAGRWQLDVVDVLESAEHAERAETDGILATPTLLCQSPQRSLRVVGNFRVDELLLRFLPRASQSLM